MESLKKEYDNFGPWLLEVRCQEEVPPLFREHYTYHSDIKTAIKIPVHIERRNAKPGDILYRSLVSFSDKEVAIYELKGNTVSEKRIAYTSIHAIQNYNNLLKGELIIFTNSGKESIQYNTVSHKIIDDIVDFLRIEYLKYSEDFFKPHQECLEVTMSQLFQNILKEMEDKEKIYILAIQPNLYLEKLKKKWYEYITNIYNKYMLQNTMFLENGKELIIISRNQPIKRRMDADYSYVHTYIPFKNIQDVAVVKDENFTEIMQVKFKVEAEVLSFFVNHKLRIKELLHR